MNHSKFKVVLTGGIGSGKSTVAEEFQKLGISVIDCDKISREIVSPNSIYLEKIKKQFGYEILTTDGSLDRQKLRNIILTNTQAKIWLEKLLHPKIYEILLERAKQTSSPYCILVIPLFFESPAPFKADRILVVTTSPRIRKERLLKQTHFSESEIAGFMKVQLDQAVQQQQAQDLIQNDGTLDQLKQRVKTLHQQYLQLASQN